MFNTISDAADDIYNSMDPPKPSLVPQTVVQNAQQFAAKMNNFDDDSDHGYYGGGCFAGSNQILMADGSLIQVKDLKKGSVIATPSGKATVKCVVMTRTF